WTNRYHATPFYENAGPAMAVDSTGNVLLTGLSWNGTNYDYVTIKYSGVGTPLWTNLSGGAAIAVDGSNNVLLTGPSLNGTNYDYATIKYSGVGTPLWTNLSGGTAIAV